MGLIIMMKLRQHDKCIMCHRPLKTYESRVAGMGPTCLKRANEPERTEGVEVQSIFKDGGKDED